MMTMLKVFLVISMSVMVVERMVDCMLMEVDRLNIVLIVVFVIKFMMGFMLTAVMHLILAHLILTDGIILMMIFDISNMTGYHQVR